MAWAHIVLPTAIFAGETIDEWLVINVEALNFGNYFRYPLSGAMGDKQEGAVNLVINFTPVALPQGQEEARVQAPVAQPVQQQPRNNS